MKSHWIAITLGCALASGCRNDPNRELLERELRLQEDKIYDLQGHVDDLRAQLDACAADNAALRQGAPATTTPPTTPRQPLFPRRSTPTPSTRPAAPAFVPPTIEPGEELEVTPGVEVDPSEVTPDLEPGTPGELPQPGTSLPRTQSGTEEGPTLDFGAPELLPDEPPLAEDNRAVQEIRLNRQLTGGWEADGQPGDDGIMVLVEPCNAIGEPLTAPGQVTVTLVDPTKPEPEQSLGEWQFAEDETALLLHQNALGRGICLELPWPAEAPQQNALRLHAHYTTTDGRQFEAFQDINVQLAGQTASHWSPATTPASHEEPRVEAAVDLAPAIRIPTPAAKKATQPEPRNTLREPHVATTTAEPDEASSPKQKADDRPSKSRIARPTWSPYR